MKINVFAFLIFFAICINVRSQERVDGYSLNGTSLLQTNAVHDYINIYQKYISGLKNGRCAMYPSCSNFGLLVFEKYNFFKALSLTSDRLIRCSHDKSFYDITYRYGIRSCIDLPNDFTPPLSKTL